MSNTDRNKPTLYLEKQLWNQGLRVVAGVDEVGRGPLAGPVMAGAVVFSPSLDLSSKWCNLVRDSKTLSSIQREHALEHIQNHAINIGLGTSEPKDIDHSGIVNATLMAMRKAVSSLSVTVDFLLVDYLEIPDLPSHGVLHGDRVCFSIAAASIVAKVARDKLMKELDLIYPNYGFSKHKGYPTRHHIKNLALLGPSPIHRLSFKPVRQYLKIPG